MTHRPDPIIDEIRRIRDEHAAEHGYDIWSIFREIQERQKASGREYVTLPPRKPKWVPVRDDSPPLRQGSRSQVIVDAGNSIVEPSPDPIIDEIRRIRDEHAARHNYDIRSIVREIRQRQKESGGTYVTLPPRKPTSLPVRETPSSCKPDDESR
jgi:hypothetical protein